MQDTILAISGKPGLYRLVSRGRGTLIVETVDAAHKRTTAGARDRVTSLGDVSMYTNDDDRPLMDIFQAIADQHEAKAVDIDFKHADAKTLADFMASVVPDYDTDRVHDSDIRKLIQWYNLLIAGGYTQFADPKAEEPAAEAEEPKAE